MLMVNFILKVQHQELLEIPLVLLKDFASHQQDKSELTKQQVQIMELEYVHLVGIMTLELEQSVVQVEVYG